MTMNAYRSQAADWLRANGTSEGEAAAVEHGLIPCGTRAGYIRHQRAGETPCAECRRAIADQKRWNNIQRRARLLSDPTLAPHGSVSTYVNWLCRCDACTDAHAERCRANSARRRAKNP